MIAKLENTMAFDENPIKTVISESSKHAETVNIYLNISQEQNTRQTAAINGPLRPPKISGELPAPNVSVYNSVRDIINRHPGTSLLEIARAFILVNLRKGKSTREVARLAGYSQSAIQLYSEARNEP